MYEILEAAFSNFLLAASFSSRFVCEKKRFHHDELRILACKNRQIASSSPKLHMCGFIHEKNMELTGRPNFDNSATLAFCLPGLPIIDES